MFDAKSDISRTVGWFTSVYPVYVPAGSSREVSERLAAVRRVLEAVPRNGVGYGALRYLGPDDVRAEFAAHQAPPIAFNYLGQFDQTLTNDVFEGGVSVARHTSDSHAAPVTRDHEIEVNARIAGSVFTAVFSFGTELYDDQTVHTLADAFTTSLRALLNAPGPGAARQASPGPAAALRSSGLSKRELNALLNKRGRG